MKLKRVDLRKVIKLSPLQEITLWQISGLYEAMLYAISIGRSKSHENDPLSILLKDPVFDVESWFDKSICIADRKNTKTIRILSKSDLESLDAWITAVNIKYPGGASYQKIQDYINNYYFDNSTNDYQLSVNNALHAIKQRRANPLLTLTKENPSVKKFTTSHYHLINLLDEMMDLIADIAYCGVLIKEQLEKEYNLFEGQHTHDEYGVIREKIKKFIDQYVRAQLMRLKMTIVVTNEFDIKAASLKGWEDRYNR